MIMPVVMTEAQRRRSQERAREWKSFRQRFLYSQSALADQLKISRRTVLSIERCELISPRYGTLRKFRTLQEREARKAAEAAA
jgi:DNA-binding XRE family transcriptional regulator